MPPRQRGIMKEAAERFWPDDLGFQAIRRILEENAA